jgi:hypothetical protein
MLFKATKYTSGLSKNIDFRFLYLFNTLFRAITKKTQRLTFTIKYHCRHDSMVEIIGFIRCKYKYQSFQNENNCHIYNLIL